MAYKTVSIPEIENAVRQTDPAQDRNTLAEKIAAIGSLAGLSVGTNELPGHAFSLWFDGVLPASDLELLLVLLEVISPSDVERNPKRDGRVYVEVDFDSLDQVSDFFIQIRSA